MPSKKYEWKGAYSSPAQQWVLTSDAKDFVAALELALRDTPDYEELIFLFGKDEAEHAVTAQLDRFQAEAFAKGENVEGQVQQNPSGTVTGSLSPAEIQEVQLDTNPPASEDVSVNVAWKTFKISMADLVKFVHEAIHEPFADGRAFQISSSLLHVSENVKAGGKMG